MKALYFYGNSNKAKIMNDMKQSYEKSIKGSGVEKIKLDTNGKLFRSNKKFREKNFIEYVERMNVKIKLSEPGGLLLKRLMSPAKPPENPPNVREGIKDSYWRRMSQSFSNHGANNTSYFLLNKCHNSSIIDSNSDNSNTKTFLQSFSRWLQSSEWETLPILHDSDSDSMETPSGSRSMEKRRSRSRERWGKREGEWNPKHSASPTGPSSDTKSRELKWRRVEETKDETAISAASPQVKHIKLSHIK